MIFFDLLQLDESQAVSTRHACGPKRRQGELISPKEGRDSSASLAGLKTRPISPGRALGMLRARLGG